MMFYTRILNGFLSSSNIIISNDKKVYMIDVCDTIPKAKNDIISKTKSAVRKAIMNI
jgi:serine/threonine-protein kinase RIO1